MGTLPAAGLRPAQLACTVNVPVPVMPDKRYCPRSLAVTGRVIDVEGPAVTYTVRKGDNLDKIADRLNTTVDDLKKDNKLRRSTIQPGQKLKGPASEAKAYVAVSGDTLAQIGKRKAVIDFGRIKLRGTIAWWIWGLAHIYFLIGLRNRLSVALSWLWIYVRVQRAARLITQGSSKVAR